MVCSLTVHIIQISLVELKFVLIAACIGVGPDRRRFEDIAVYAGPKILAVFKINLVSIHPHSTFYLPGQLRTTRSLCRAPTFIFVLGPDPAHSSHCHTISAKQYFGRLHLTTQVKNSPIDQFSTIELLNGVFPFILLLFSSTSTSSSSRSSSSSNGDGDRGGGVG